jgi:transposase
LSGRQQNRLIELFVTGSTARVAAELTGIQANTAARFILRLRPLIASKLPSYKLSGEVEADESYFGGVRQGRRGRGAAGKVAVFGLLKRKGKVYPAIIPNARTETMLLIIQEKVRPDSIVYTDTFRVDNAVDVPGFHHVRMNHCECFADRHNHINGLENFWNQAKRIYAALTGLKRNTFTGF